MIQENLSNPTDLPIKSIHTVSRNYSQPTGVCIMIRVSANCHISKVTSGVFILVVIGLLRKQTM